jgi:hypothetical protein
MASRSLLVFALLFICSSAEVIQITTVDNELSTFYVPYTTTSILSTVDILTNFWKPFMCR